MCVRERECVCVWERERERVSSNMHWCIYKHCIKTKQLSAGLQRKVQFMCLCQGFEHWDFFMQVVYAVDTDSVAAGLLLFVFHFSHFYFLTCFFGGVYVSFFVFFFFFWCVCVFFLNTFGLPCMFVGIHLLNDIFICCCLCWEQHTMWLLGNILLVHWCV